MLSSQQINPGYEEKDLSEAYFKFAQSMSKGEEIPVYNYGKDMKRDFTFIDDVVSGVTAVLEKIPTPQYISDVNNPSQSTAPYRIYNIGSHDSVTLMNFISAIEQVVGRRARINFLPVEAGDVKETFADVEDAQCDFNFTPSTKVEDGIQKLWNWYKEFYHL